MINVNLAAGEKVHTFCPVTSFTFYFLPSKKEKTIGLNFVSFVLLDRRQKADFQRMGYENIFIPNKFVIPVFYIKFFNKSSNFQVDKSQPSPFCGSDGISYNFTDDYKCQLLCGNSTSFNFK